MSASGTGTIQKYWIDDEYDFSFMRAFCQVSVGVWCLSNIIRAFEHGELSLFEITTAENWPYIIIIIIIIIIVIIIIMILESFPKKRFCKSNEIIWIIAIVGFAPISLFVAFIILYE